jgi:hypothetical protein
VGYQLLEIEIKEAYFIMGLSKIGAPIIFYGHRATPLQTDDYIAQFCMSGSHKESGRIAIKDVRDIPLQDIIFTITKLAGST